ncbi:MAG: glycosyltransferase [Candidatus Pacebacteria bacterium]|nr:glycosyltransferase [Candidatus Paceibacterota bacterium]
MILSILKRTKKQSNDPKATRDGVKLNLWVWLVIFIPISLVYYSLNDPTDGWLNWYLSFVWSFDIIPSFLGIAGAILFIRAKKQKKVLVKRSTHVHKQVVFLIPSICRDDTIPALCRVIDSILKHAPDYLENWRIDIVTEEGAQGLTRLKQIYSFSNVRILVVPTKYKTPNGTKYKARANQYSLEIRRANGENKSDVFVYHLDDDTAVGADTVQSIAQFILNDRGQYHAAQGVLTFPWQLSRSFLTRMADSIRPADDLTRFYFFTGYLGKPLVGFHGEHLLLRASVEDEIGWDFGPKVKVEDAYFALYFNQHYSGKSTFLDSCTYGASPETVKDLIKQRRRWAAGLLGLLFDPTLKGKPRWLMAIFVTNWVLSPMRHLMPVFIVAMIIGATTSPVSQWVVFIWTLGFATWIWQYFEGLRINLSVSEPRRHYLLYACTLFPLFFIITMIETVAVAAGFYDFSRGKQSFEVISKSY